MRKVTHIITLVLAWGFLLISTQSYAKNTPTPILIKGVHSYSPTSNYNYYPIALNTFNRLFSFYFHQEAVCRKPTNINFWNSNIGFTSKRYNFEEFTTSKISKTNAFFIKVEGYSTYKSGNSTMLIPHSYTKPIESLYNIETPKIIIHKAN